MKLMTSERCPECGQIIYMDLHRKDLKNDLVIGDGCYLDLKNPIMFAFIVVGSHEDGMREVWIRMD